MRNQSIAEILLKDPNKIMGFLFTQDVDVNGFAAMDEPVKGKTYTADEALRFIFNEGGPVDMPNSDDEDDMDLSNETNLFGIQDVEDMCCEAIGLIGKVDDLFQNKSLYDNSVQQEQKLQQPYKYDDSRDSLIAHKEISSNAINYSDSEESSTSNIDRCTGAKMVEQFDEDYDPNEASGDSTSKDEEEMCDDRVNKRRRLGPSEKNIDSDEDYIPPNEAPEDSSSSSEDSSLEEEEEEVANMISESEKHGDTIPENQIDFYKENDGEKVSAARGDSGKMKKSHPLLPPCKCKRKCIEKVCQDTRKDIHERFWNLNRDERLSWIHNNINRGNKKTSTKESCNLKNRQLTCEYLLRVSTGKVQVCKVFFLATLGYKYDTIITKLFRSTEPSAIKAKPDGRGKHKPKHAMPVNTLDIIDKHIESFNPSISHYRRAHAPLRRYLAPELGLSLMFRYFKETYPEIKVSQETYRRRLHLKNISFCKLGEEECEVCLALTHHQCQKKDAPENNSGPLNPQKNNERNGKNEEKEKKIEDIVPGVCSVCDDWLVHIQLANESRDAYRKDADTYHDPKNGAFYMSADMMLPGVKTAVFTRRIIAYHETFAPLVPTKEVRKQWKNEGKKIKPVKPIGIVWHEGIQGRFDEDVSSTVHKCLRDPRYREAKHIIIWADNCTGQLKNWTFYASLVYEVNNLHASIETITIKYFEKGHTYMSADSFHASVETTIRKMKRLYDFDDFVRSISKNGIVIEMKEGDFIDYKEQLSTAKDTNYPYLRNIFVVEFRKGSTKMFWKETHATSEFKSGEFIQKNIVTMLKMEI